MIAEGTFGARLRRARLGAGLSQSELEIRSGIPKARLSRYENGHVLPSIGTLTRLSDALGISHASLLGDRRAVIEEFFQVLLGRGVIIATPEQARVLAGAVADLARALTSDESLGSIESAASVKAADGSVAEMLAPPA